MQVERESFEDEYEWSGGSLRSLKSSLSDAVPTLAQWRDHRGSPNPDHGGDDPPISGRLIEPRVEAKRARARDDARFITAERVWSV